MQSFGSEILAFMLNLLLLNCARSQKQVSLLGILFPLPVSTGQTDTRNISNLYQDLPEHGRLGLSRMVDALLWSSCHLKILHFLFHRLSEGIFYSL